MPDDWYQQIVLPLTWEQFHQLPRNPDYKYEYFGSEAVLTPRPLCFDAVLNLTPRPNAGALIANRGRLTLRALGGGDWPHLPGLLAAAFWRIPPFGSLNDEERMEAAADCVSKTQKGTYGPLVREACFVAAGDEPGHLTGAIIVTLRPVVRERERRGGTGAEPLGLAHEQSQAQPERPYVTWIFVAPYEVRYGIGSALLDCTANALLHAGHRELWSSFSLGNPSSILWHWRNGFHVIESAFSRRAMMRRL